MEINASHIPTNILASLKSVLLARFRFVSLLPSTAHTKTSWWTGSSASNPDDVLREIRLATAGAISPQKIESVRESLRRMGKDDLLATANQPSDDGPLEAVDMFQLA